MLGVKYTDRTSNAEVHQKMGTEPLIRTIQQRQLRYVGHCIRKPTVDLIHQYVLYEPVPSHGKRRPGRRAPSYAEYVGRLINNQVPPRPDEIRAMAANRTEWRKIVRACNTVFAAD